MPYIHHTQEEEDAIRNLTDMQLSKKNNRHYTGAIIYETDNKRDKHEEAYDIVRDELAERGILESVETKRLIDGRELVEE